MSLQQRLSRLEQHHAGGRPEPLTIHVCYVENGQEIWRETYEPIENPEPGGPYHRVIISPESQAAIGAMKAGRAEGNDQ